MNVPFLDLASAYTELQAEIEAAVARVLTSGWYIGGPEVDRFEKDFAEYCGARYCVGVASGYDALHLALRALGIGQGDEVILASNSYIATVLAVTAVSATPVLVEPNPATYNLDPDLVERAVSDRTKALLPTHLYGQSADLDPLIDIANRHGLKLLEDAAQAHGARYKGQRIGAHGDVAAWSFYPTKNLGAMGDAGAITTNNKRIADTIRLLGNYGSAQRYVADVKGVNSRLDPIQAAILGVKLRRLDEWNGRRRAIADLYGRGLVGAGCTLPTVANGADPAWHLYVIQCEEREDLAAALADKDVQTLVHYPIPPHLQLAYADLGFRRGAFPIAERLADTVMSLPIGPHLPLDKAEKIVRVIHDGNWRKNERYD